MISKKNKPNIFLIIVISLSFITYGYFIIKNKGSVKVEDSQLRSEIKDRSSFDDGITKFSDVEYKTFSGKNDKFTTKGKLAYISRNRPEQINLQEVHSFTKLKDGTVLNINSNKAEYFKDTKNIKYYDDVKITNKDIIIKSESANFIYNKNLIKLINVVYNDKQNILKTDFAELNTITNNLEMFMKNKKDRVYGYRKQK